MNHVAASSSKTTYHDYQSSESEGESDNENAPAKKRARVSLPRITGSHSKAICPRSVSKLASQNPSKNSTRAYDWSQLECMSELHQSKSKLQIVLVDLLK